jgi:hypothetical protein
MKETYMRKNHLWSLVAVGWVLACAGLAPAGSFVEEFDDNPFGRGWRMEGEAQLFHWDASNQNLQVTWDSRQPNSYFYRPLGTVLTRADDFSLSFDLRLEDITVGIDPQKPYTFQIAIGFLSQATATQTNFLRATGMDSPNLVEFDYFPDSGFGATVSPTVISTNHQFATSFNFPLELTTNDLFHVELRYTASNQTLATKMTRNGFAFGPIEDVVLRPDFTDFRVDQLAIMSYSDAGQDPRFAGSVLAHGCVDHIVLRVPDPPLDRVNGGFSLGQWQMSFQTKVDWVYQMERTSDFAAWIPCSAQADGTGAPLMLADTNAPGARAWFYRVRADRP